MSAEILQRQWEEAIDDDRFMEWAQNALTARQLAAAFSDQRLFVNMRTLATAAHKQGVADGARPAGAVDTASRSADTPCPKCESPTCPHTITTRKRTVSRCLADDGYDAQVTADLLNLVVHDGTITIELVQTWTPAQVEAAEHWAGACHLDASDNDVEIPQRPLHTFPDSGLYCGECGERQYETPGGACCVNGHGGAEGVKNK